MRHKNDAFVWWPTGANAQQLKKYMQIDETRKHLHQFDNTCSIKKTCRKYGNAANTDTLQTQKRCKYKKRQWKCFQQTLKVLNTAWARLLLRFVTHEVIKWSVCHLFMFMLRISDFCYYTCVARRTLQSKKEEI